MCEELKYTRFGPEKLFHLISIVYLKKYSSREKSSKVSFSGQERRDETAVAAQPYGCNGGKDGGASKDNASRPLAPDAGK